MIKVIDMIFTSKFLFIKVPKSSQIEVDLFSSSGTNDSNNRKLKSPVKTQPLKVSFLGSIRKKYCFTSEILDTHI